MPFIGGWIPGMNSDFQNPLAKKVSENILEGGYPPRRFFFGLIFPPPLLEMASPSFGFGLKEIDEFNANVALGIANTKAANALKELKAAEGERDELLADAQVKYAKKVAQMDKALNHYQNEKKRVKAEIERLNSYLESVIKSTDTLEEELESLQPRCNKGLLKIEARIEILRNKVSGREEDKRAAEKKMEGGVHPPKNISKPVFPVEVLKTKKVVQQIPKRIEEHEEPEEHSEERGSYNPIVLSEAEVMAEMMKGW